MLSSRKSCIELVRAEVVSHHPRKLHQWTNHKSLATQLHKLTISDPELQAFSLEGSEGPSESSSLRPLGINIFSLGSVRFGFPRGTQPKPRYQWDWRALDKMIGGSGQNWEELKKRQGGTFKHFKKDWRTWGTNKIHRYFTYNYQDWKRGEMVPPEFYTPEPLKIPRLGGRDPENRAKINFHIGGGVNFDYYLIDWFRTGPTTPGDYYVERVLEIRKDPNRTPYIALVAGNKGKRWILATENMEAGQLIRTTSYLPRDTITGKEGDAHPVGALAVDSLVCCVEMYPGRGATNYLNAASAATIMRRQKGMVILKDGRNKREFALKPECMVTVGRLSRMVWKDLYYGSANMHRRFGYKQQSGPTQKKDQYSGRKARATLPPKQFDSPPELPPETYKVTLKPHHLTNSFGTAASNRTFRLSSVEALAEDYNSQFELQLPGTHEDEIPQ